MPAGAYESFWPSDIAIWLNISPFQAYTQEVYDPDEKEVIEVTTTWFEYLMHFIPKLKRKINCSAGPHRELPCFPCARRALHYERLDAIEEEKGFRPDEEPDVGRSRQFALAITIMEKIYAIPKQDKKGRIMKNRANKPIYRHIPAPLVDLDEDDGVSYPTKFGHKAHWSMGIQQRDQLLAFDEKLKTRCANCAGDLMALARICPDCENTADFGEPKSGVDLEEYRQKRFKCRSCGYGDKDDEFLWVYRYECPDCGDPAEGGLLHFDLRIRKIPSGDKSVLDLVGFRVPTDDEEVQKLIQSPLKLDEIFTPHPLDIQKKILGDKAKGIDPSHGAFTKDYTDAEGEGSVDFS